MPLDCTDGQTIWENSRFAYRENLRLRDGIPKDAFSLSKGLPLGGEPYSLSVSILPSNSGSKASVRAN